MDAARRRDEFEGSIDRKGTEPMRPFRIAAFLAAAFAASAPAEEARHGDLRISDAYAFESAGMSGAGYMTLANEGAGPVALIGARSEASARTELHDTMVDAAGVARMVEQARIEIAPGQTVRFEPGGLHVMFMGLEDPLEAGATTEVELIFEDGVAPVTLEIRERGAPAAHGHDHGS